VVTVAHYHASEGCATHEDVMTKSLLAAVDPLREQFQSLRDPKKDNLLRVSSGDGGPFFLKRPNSFPKTIKFLPPTP